MTIGLYFECYKKSGGVYQYTLNLIEALKQNRNHTFIVFTISPDFPFDQCNLPNWKVISLTSSGKQKQPAVNIPVAAKESFKRKLTLFTLNTLRALKLYRLEIFLTRIKAKKRAAALKGYGIDLMFFHGPSELSFLTDIPSIVPIHDIHHRLHSESPDVVSLGQWQKREYLYNNIKKTAYKILVNSKTTKDDLIALYKIEPDKIEVMPCPPPLYIRTPVTEERKHELMSAYNLPKEFLFYPAQFWPHKNHQNLVKAISILKKHDGKVTPLVLVGSPQGPWGEFEKVKKLIDKNGLQNDVHILGYVKNEEMPVLYGMAIAMVMPALFGFTYPVFEAWATGVPVLYSNARDSLEQVGDAALIVDPKNPDDIAEKIKMIIENEKLRHTLSENGARRLKNDSQENLNKKIESLIGEFEKKMKDKIGA